ncbi:MAG: hypothetical protein SNG02_00115 [Rikenellaceae bacterium]
MKRKIYSAIALMIIVLSTLSGPKVAGKCKDNCCAGDTTSECTSMLGDNSEKTICSRGRQRRFPQPNDQK